MLGHVGFIFMDHPVVEITGVKHCQEILHRKEEKRIRAWNFEECLHLRRGQKNMRHWGTPLRKQSEWEVGRRL